MPSRSVLVPVDGEDLAVIGARTSISGDHLGEGHAFGPAPARRWCRRVEHDEIVRPARRGICTRRWPVVRLRTVSSNVMSSPRAKLVVSTPAESRSDERGAERGAVAAVRYRDRCMSPLPSEAAAGLRARRHQADADEQRESCHHPSREKLNMSPPEKPLTDAEVDALYGLEPVIGADASRQWTVRRRPEFVTVSCPYCGEAFETSADASAGPCNYVEDCQICCQPIEMELRVDEDGAFARAAGAARR